MEKTKKKSYNKKLSVDIYRTDAQKTGKISLNPSIFSSDINDSLLAQYIYVFRNNQRSGSASAKTRSEVKGSTRKIYRQKGTGRARHGDIKAPIFIGGGIAHGPQKRDYSKKITKKMKKMALFAALAYKLKEQNLFIIKKLEDIENKTKYIVEMLKKFKVYDDKKKTSYNIMFLVSGKDNHIFRAARNIPKVNVNAVAQINAYEILANKAVFISDKAMAEMEDRFIKGKEVMEENTAENKSKKNPVGKSRKSILKK